MPVYLVWPHKTSNTNKYASRKIPRGLCFGRFDTGIPRSIFAQAPGSSWSYVGNGECSWEFPRGGDTYRMSEDSESTVRDLTNRRDYVGGYMPRRRATQGDEGRSSMWAIAQWVKKVPFDLRRTIHRSRSFPSVARSVSAKAFLPGLVTRRPLHVAPFCVTTPVASLSRFTYRLFFCAPRGTSLRERRLPGGTLQQLYIVKKKVDLIYRPGHFHL